MIGRRWKKASGSVDGMYRALGAVGAKPGTQGCEQSCTMAASPDPHVGIEDWGPVATW
jgi:hypothetical protein